MNRINRRDRGEWPQRGRSLPLLTGAFAILFAFMALADCAHGQVTFDRLVNSAKEPQNWMTYSGDYLGRRFSALDQVNTTNVRALTAKWVYQTAATGKLETSPLVVDGILYATAQDDRAFALDARTGRPIWMYQHPLPGDIRPCCGRVNRGLAIVGDKVFLGTLDAHVIALDSKTGNVVWDVVAADYRTGHSFTVAPLAVKDLVVIGVSGGEYGVRGFIDAYDAATGKRRWRFYTVPGPGEPGNDTWEGDSWKVGGAPAWNTGTYDAVTNQIFWPTGNPAPSNRGEGRAGANLFTNARGAHSLSRGAGHDQLHGADLRSANRTVLCDGPRPVRYFQHGSATLRGGARVLRQRLFSFGRGQAVSRIPEGYRSSDRAGEVEV